MILFYLINPDSANGKLLRDIVANDDKSGRRTIIFDDSSQCRLSLRGHQIGLIEDDNFIYRTDIAPVGKLDV